MDFCTCSTLEPPPSLFPLPLPPFMWQTVLFPTNRPIRSTCPPAACSDILPIKPIYLPRKLKSTSLSDLGTKNCRNPIIASKRCLFPCFMKVKYDLSSWISILIIFLTFLHKLQCLQLYPRASGRSSSSGGSGGENWTSSEIGEGGA